jgi:hypothetical protein
MSDLGCTLGVSDKSTTKEIEMVLITEIGIRTDDGMVVILAGICDHCLSFGYLSEYGTCPLVCA